METDWCSEMWRSTVSGPIGRVGKIGLTRETSRIEITKLGYRISFESRGVGLCEENVGWLDILMYILCGRSAHGSVDVAFGVCSRLCQ